MKRKGMGKRIATMVLAITMSISMAGFQTGIVKADITEGEATIDVITGDETIGDVITGDEVLVVLYKDYTIKKFDSSNTRCEDSHDGGYPIYNEQIGLNFLKDEDFLNCKDSYDYLLKD